MYSGTESSVTQAENCAESATTEAPQIDATISSQAGLADRKNPITRQQAPEIAIAQEVTRVRPARSARKPAMTQPTAPDPITRKAAASASECGLPLASSVDRITTGAHVHIA